MHSYPFRKGRIFRFNEQDRSETVRMTEAEVMSSYFGYWSGQMKKAGKEDLISRENCIEDFKVVHWAWEVHE